MHVSYQKSDLYKIKLGKEHVNEAIPIQKFALQQREEQTTIVLVIFHYILIILKKKLTQD